MYVIVNIGLHYLIDIQIIFDIVGFSYKKKMKKKNTSIPMSNIKIVESGKTDNPNKNT